MTGNPTSSTPDPNHQYTLGDGGNPTSLTPDPNHQYTLGDGGNPTSLTPDPNHQYTLGDGGNPTSLTPDLNHRYTLGDGEGGGNPTSPTPDPNQQHTLGDGGWGGVTGEPYITNTRPKPSAQTVHQQNPRAAHAPLTCEEALRPAPQALQQRSPEEGAQVQRLPGASPLKAVEQGGQRQVSRQRQ